MKQNKKAMSSLSLVLAVLMLLSSLAIIPVSAARITTEESSEADNLNWTIQPKNATSIEEIEITDQYTLENKAATLQNVDGESCFAFNHSALFINDIQNMLVKCDTFYVDYKVYFEKFPVGGRDGLTSDQYPIAIFTWIVDNNYDRSIRIDSKGNLFFTRNTSDAIGVQLSLKTWYNLRFAITPETGAFEIYLDNNLVFSKMYKSMLKSNKSQVRFFDTAYEYDAYVKDVSVYSSKGYQIIAGVNSENSADYLGYQTTTPTDSSFDVRFISTLSKLEGYNQSGYNVTATIKDHDGTITEDSEIKNAKYMYEAINADGVSVSAKDYEAEYFTTFTVEDLPTDVNSIMITIRPYVVKNGLRAYGHSTVLFYSGQMKDGRPVMTSSTTDDNAFSELAACDDTYIQGAYANEAQGNKTTVVVKANSGPNARTAFVKFKITDDIEDAFINAEQINLKLNFKTIRQRTAQEEAAGGYPMNIYAVNSDWDEETLTFNSAKDTIEKGEIVGEFLISSNGFVSADVTAYVRDALLEGEEYISFLLYNAVDDGSSGQTVFSAKEESIEKAPALEISAGESLHLNYELNLPKAGNVGYEPWGYAEKLVKDWMNGGKDKVYAADNNSVFELEPVDISKKPGAHTILTEGRSTGNPPSGKYKTLYARNIDTLAEKAGYQIATAETESQFDEYGGVTNSGIKGNATGYFHVEFINNRHYLIDPIGNPFIVNAVNSITAGTTSNQKAIVLEKFGTEEAYWEYITETLMGMGINAATGFTDVITSAKTPMSGIASISGISSYMKSLGLSVSTGGSSAFAYNNTMNVFDPDFITHVEEVNKETLIHYSTNDRIIGYTSDNELPKNKDMLLNYLTLDPKIHYNAFSYAAAWTWLKAKTGMANPSVEDAIPEYYEEFKAFVFSRLFETVDKVIEKYDSNHMYIGTRADSSNKTSEGYLRAAGTYCDMLTINMYDGMEPSVETMATIYRYSGKPFIVTEFYAKAEDAYDLNGQLLANQQNAGWLVKTQEDRANYFENYTLLLLESKYCLGWVWYRFQDNDQSLYTNDGGKTILRVWERGSGYDIVSYIDQNGNVIKAKGTEVQIYKGETDTSNLGSNKGIVDNNMEFYEMLCDSMTRVAKNSFSLIKYFDSIH